MREGNVLTPVCVSVHTCGGRGGTPSQVWGRGGTPSQVWPGGGVPIPGLDTPQAWDGVPLPQPDLGWGTPWPDLAIPGLDGGGYPIPGVDTPRDLGWGTPPQTWDRVPPKPGTVCLLRSRRRTFLFHSVSAVVVFLLLGKLKILFVLLFLDCCHLLPTVIFRFLW